MKKPEEVGRARCYEAIGDLTVIVVGKADAVVEEIYNQTLYPIAYIRSQPNRGLPTLFIAKPCVIVLFEIIINGAEGSLGIVGAKEVVAC